MRIGFNPFLPTRMEDRFTHNNTLDSPFGTQQPNEQNPDFLSRYLKLLQGQRPNQDAFRQAVLEGPPTFEPTKMNRLGAILSGGLTGFGQGATAGINAANSFLQKPQELMDKRYNTKVQNLAALSDFEGNDLESQMKGLEFENDLDTRRRADVRSDRDFTENKRVNDANIDSRRRDDERQDITEFEDETTGEKKSWNRRTGEIKVIGKTGRSLKEKDDVKLEDDKRKFAHEDSMNNADNASLDRRSKMSTDASIANTNTRASATRDSATIRANMQKYANGLKPGDQAKQVIVDLTEAAAKDPDLANVDLSQYLDSDATTGALNVKKESMFGDDLETQAIKAKIRQIISDSIGKSKTPGAGRGISTPSNTSLPSGWSRLP